MNDPSGDEAYRPTDSAPSESNKSSDKQLPLNPSKNFNQDFNFFGSFNTKLVDQVYIDDVESY